MEKRVIILFEKCKNWIHWYIILVRKFTKHVIFLHSIYRFVCENCHKKRSTKRVENRFTSKRLPTTRLGTFIETRVNNFLRKKEAESGEVYIRVVFSGDKTVEVKNGMKKRWVLSIYDKVESISIWHVFHKNLIAISLHTYLLC